MSYPQDKTCRWSAHEAAVQARGREGLFEVNPLYGGEPRRTLPCANSNRCGEESPEAYPF